MYPPCLTLPSRKGMRGVTAKGTDRMNGWKRQTQRTVLSVALAAGIGGCSGDFKDRWLRTGGVVEPTPAEVKTTIEDFKTSITGTDGGAYTYAMAGMEKVRHDCNRFFDALALLRREANTTRDLFAIGGGTTAAVLGIVSASAKAISLTAAGFAATDLGINTVQNNMLFVPVAEELKRLTSEAMHSFATDQTTLDVLADLKKLSGQPTLGDQIAARKIVGVYASFCAPSSIESYVKQALSKSSASVTDAGVTGAGHSAVQSALAAIGLSPMDDGKAATVAAFLRGGYLDAERRKAFAASFPDAATNSLTSAPLALSPNGRIAAELFEVAIRADPSFRKKVEAAGAATVDAALKAPAAAAPAVAAPAPAGADALSKSMNLKTNAKVSSQ